ncbi:MAG TPA: hypothetical protein VGR97_00965 [Candidatus Acidoferrales bacterium]|nr:hypothetical protein [Candidatus Acidoferrales bacterium]
MSDMPNQAYLNVWCTDFSEDRIIERFSAFLQTVPFSATHPGFTSLTIRAVNASEQPILEQDLRAMPLDAAGVTEIARDHVHGDCSCETSGYWDLATFDPGNGKSKIEPQTLEISCRGEDYDDALWRQNGHFEVNLGFEHFFTGHARLLGMRPGPSAPAESPEEARFLEAMAWPDNLEKYRDNTRENIRKLLEWLRRIEGAIPVERVQLWSEGEDNFEARLEEIAAAS